MLTRIFGLHGCGKSEYIYSMLEKSIQNKKQAFLIVPEQQAVSAERMLIDKLGNPANMYIEVINFKRLCNRVFRESGGVSFSAPEKAAFQFAMAQVLHDVSDNLKEYNTLAPDADFALKMLSTVEQMHRGRITPEILESVLPQIKSRGSESLYNKLCDISLAYTGYSAFLEQNLDFPGDLLEMLYETLCGFDFFKGKTVLLDSFYGFTAEELAVIGKIIATADNTYITFLCTDEKQQDKCFARGTTAARACRKLAEKNSVEYTDVFLKENKKHKNSPALENISQNFSLSFNADTVTEEKDYDDGLEIYECDNIYKEAQCAAKIASDLICHGVKPREIAVCARDIQVYEGILDIYFEKAQIPFSFDKHTDLSSTPVAALIKAAFEVYFTWSLQSVINYIKTGLSGLSDEQADTLEIYMRTWNINGKKYFHENWMMNPDGIVEAQADIKKLESINNSKDIILSCLDSFCEQLDNAEKASDIARAAYTLTVDIARASGKESFDDGADGVYSDLLYRILDCAVQTIGSEKMTPKRFFELYKSVMKNMSAGKIPELIDQVRTSSVNLMRTDGVKHVIILGVNDRVFPKAPDNAEILRDSERVLLKQLGIDFADTDDDKAYDEIFLAYTALCCASKCAYVLYSKETLSGEKLYPSVIISILKSLCKTEEKKYSGDNIIENAISDEVLFDLYLTLPPGEEKATVREYFLQNEAYRERILSSEQGDFSQKPLSNELIAKLYKGDMTGSYTRLEKYRECPFKHFCKYTLKLSPEPVAKLGAFETGNIVHKLLEELVPSLINEYMQDNNMSDAYIKQQVREKLAELLSRFMSANTEASSKRFEYMFNRLEDSVNALCLELIKELQISKFVPVDFELKISPDGDVKPIQTVLADGRKLSIIGAIDRVDLFHDEKTDCKWVRITDYKTGSKEFRLDDIHNGFNLQMLLYLYTLTSVPSKRYGKVYPAGVTYRMVTRPSADKSFDKASDDDFKEPETTSAISGLAVEDMDIVFAMDPTGTGRFSPAKLTKSGEVSGNVVSLDNLSDLLKETIATATELANGILAGNKRIAPFKDATHDACKYCDYSPICNNA